MPSVSRARQSFSSLAWGFKFSKFSILDRNFINWSWSKQKLICKEGIHADTYEFVIIHSDCISLHYTTCWLLFFYTCILSWERLLGCMQKVPQNYDKVCTPLPTIWALWDKFYNLLTVAM